MLLTTIMKPAIPMTADLLFPILLDHPRPRPAAPQPTAALFLTGSGVLFADADPDLIACWTA